MKNKTVIKTTKRVPGVRPVKVAGYSSAVLRATRAAKRSEAEERQATYDSLTRAERVALVQSRGGSVRELARLAGPKSK